MPTETQEKPNTTHQEEQNAELRQSVYDELKTFVETDGKTGYDFVQKEARNQTDPLSRVLTEYVDNNAETNEKKDEIWQHIAFAIGTYLAFGVINEKLSKEACVQKAFNEINTGNYIAVRAQKGDQVSISTFPKEIVADKSDEEIIEMAKSCPNNTDMQDAEFSIMTPEQLIAEIAEINNRMSKKEEKEECQTNNEQTIKQ